jgi:hypothetical protein
MNFLVDAHSRGDTVSNPFDFDDGSRLCEQCGASFPEEEAQALLRTQYKENVDFPGQFERSQRQLVVCPRCRRRLLRWQWLRNLRDTFGMYLAVAFAVGVFALVVFGLLIALGVLG